MEPCKECPFWAEKRGKLDVHLVMQMEASAQSLGGFPCHMRHPRADILTCPGPQYSANDCVGYARMQANMNAERDPHPEVVGCFDELIS